MSPPRRRWLRALLACLISALLIAALLSQIDPAEAIERVRGAEPGPILAALGFSALMLFARTLRYRLVTTRSGLGDVAAATAVQVAANRLAPLRLGELSLPWLLHRASGEPPVPIVVHLLLIRLLELWVVLVAAAIAAGLWFAGRDSGASPLVAGLGVAGLSLSLLAFRRLVRFGVAIGRRLAAATPLRKVAALPKIFDQLDAAVEDAARLDPKRRLALFGLTVAVMALNYAVFGALLAALGFQLDPRQIVIGVTASQLAGALPVLSVGSLGTHETGWTAGFAWVGMAVPDAVLSGLFTQAVTLGFAVLFALPAAARVYFGGSTGGS